MLGILYDENEKPVKCVYGRTKEQLIAEKNKYIRISGKNYEMHIHEQKRYKRKPKKQKPIFH